ncbi:YIP1 family protein [Ferrimonas senticii]|uniref:YIP1 family protein n=1 Tax=Ferrimonas senticii TaxID=394566 RepID=UPI000407484D|nr:YIP1 family protein [Ferrimonas senticii]
MTTTHTPWQAILAMATAPSTVFTALKQQQHWSWLAFLLVIIATIVAPALYFQLVDWPWYLQHYVLGQLAGLAPAEQQAALELMTRSGMQLSTPLFATISLLVINALTALYLHKMTQLDDDNIQSFGDWFGFGWWTLLPQVVGAVIAIAVILVSGQQLDPAAALTPLSLANLAGLTSDSPWYNFGSSLSLLTLWTIALQYLGVRAWTALSSGISVVIVTIPYLVIFGIWALLV